MHFYKVCEILFLQDKRIRACFLRFFADLLVGYRYCLEVIRLHSPPLIVFHKSAFLGLREFSSYPLIRSFLDSLLFQSFISERGLPFRICDLFDEVCILFKWRRMFCRGWVSSTKCAQMEYEMHNSINLRLSNHTI